MAHVIAFVNQKGGTGKTTTALNTGAYLAALGKRVLLVDMDPQANATSGLGINPHGLETHIYHGLIGSCHPGILVKKTALFGYELLPSAPDLAGAAVELVAVPDREQRLAGVLQRIKTHYDYVLIDSPPSLSLLTVNGLIAADQTVIPVQCEYYALEGLGQLLRTLQLLSEGLGRQIVVKGALLTMYDRRLELAREVEKQMRRSFPGYVFDTVIPRNVELAQAPSFGKTILQFDPTSRGARAYRQFAQELLRLDGDAAQFSGPDPEVREQDDQPSDSVAVVEERGAAEETLSTTP